MCGLYAEWGTEYLAKEAILSAMRSRGPDDHGHWQQPLQHGVLHLLHTRLAIVDLSRAGHQPMLSDASNHGLVFNGEIYNHNQLRQELEQAGYRFRSKSDTEVLLHGYRHWGTDLFPRLEGIFACVFWDAERQELVLARDPLGVKPLLWWRTSSGWAVGSELAAFRGARRPHQPQLDPLALEQFWTWGAVQAPRTMVRDLEVFPAGHWARWRPGQPGDRWQFQAFNSWPERSWTTDQLSYAEAVEGVGTRLEQAVARQMLADVPVGAFLSGGIDSAALVALMGRHTSHPVQTISLGFREIGSVADERSAAAEVARHLGTDHRSIEVGAAEAEAWFPDFVDALDQPSVDGFNTYLVARCARQQGLKVALSGLGGDELFAGYPSFQAAWSHQQRPQVASVLRARLPRRLVQRLGWDSAAFEAGAASGAAWFRQLPWGERLEIPLAAQELEPHLDGLDLPAQLSRLELAGYMANILLRDSDAVTMHHGLELRVPFLDGDLVRYALQLPGAYRLRVGSLKPLLVDAMQGLLPDSVLNGVKRGFELPFARWLQGWPEPQLDPGLLGHAWPARVSRARAQFLRQPRHYRSWWQWTVLAAWIRAWPNLALPAE